MREYDIKFKRHIVESLVKYGKKVSVISEKYNINISTLYRWKREYKLYGESSFMRNTHRSLRKK
ncbi:MAG: transposase [Clostridium sp.]|nr:transposase [Clostridium sp.]